VRINEPCSGLFPKSDPPRRKNGGDQLFVRKAKNPNFTSDVTSDGKPWTTFTMELREPTPMPEPLEFARFLATSLAFTTKIRHLSLYFDDYCLASFEKKLAQPRPLSVPSGLNLTSPAKLLSVKSMDQTSVQIDVQVLRWVSQLAAVKAKASRPQITKMFSFLAPTAVSAATETSQKSLHSEDPLFAQTATLFLRIVGANIAVSCPTRFINEIERATKKPPPKSTVLQLIYTSKDEFDASSSKSANGQSSDEIEARKVFEGLLSDLNRQGRVFIGFATHQSTGCAAPLAARFISTVERESIDFQAAYVADWYVHTVLDACWVMA
jgi:hypothetical protein